jgi:adenylylsulfate kinase
MRAAEREWISNEGADSGLHRRPTAQPGFTVWLTGLPCSGKSTVAAALSQRLSEELSRPVQVLDGDEFRRELSAELGFSARDRDVNVSRMGYVASLLTTNGVPVVVAAVSPYREARAAVRARCERFVEVFVECSLETCERRDVKGMYALARAGKLERFTGVSDVYEAPLAPELTVNTDNEPLTEIVERIVGSLRSAGYF